MSKAVCKDKDIQQMSDPHLFGYTAHCFERFMENKLRPYNIGIEQLGVLYLLRHYYTKNLSIREISSLLAKNITTTSRILSSLEKKGLLKRTKDEKDKRITYVSLTEQGYKKIDKIAFLKNEMDNIFNSTLTQDEKNTLRSVLAKLIKAVSCD